MKSNLHMHSKYSDGTMWPEEIILRAKRFGLEMISLTDHDSLEGTETFLNYCKKNNILGIAGTEIDCVAPEIDYDIELLCYFPGREYKKTKTYLRDCLSQREKNIKKFLKNAEDEYSTKLSFEELKEMKIGFNSEVVFKEIFAFTKVDLYEYLIYKNLLSPTTPYRTFKDSKIYNIKNRENKFHVKDVIKLAEQDNGYVVLPHPGHMLNDNLEQIETQNDAFEKKIKFFKEAGIWGIELYYYHNNSDKINSLIKEYAQKYDLKITYGSDCHGRGSRNDSLEKFYGNTPKDIWK